MWPHRRQPTRLPRPWDSPGKNPVVGCHCLLQYIKVKSESEVAQSCPTLRNPMNCSLPGSSIHGIFQARVLEWGAITFSILVLGFLINTYLFCGSILLIYFILTTIMMLLSLLPLFLVCLGWDLQCFSQLSSSVFRTNPKRPQRGLGQQVFCHLRSVSLTDQNGSLVGFLLLTGMLAAVSCHGGPIDCHMFILTYLPFRTWVQY